jgi:homoserine dehydrogenase
MSRKHLTIGIFGFGTVAQGFVAALEQSRGISAEIKQIVVRDAQKSRPAAPAPISTDRNLILNDPEINVVVELTDDAAAALAITKAALANGKAVITASKRLIAEHFAELVALQRQYDLPILYEAAACGSIPIIRNLEEYYDNDLLRGLEGIFNGSSNYVLSKVFRDGLSFPEALDLAFDEGFLESDPRLDLEGIDAAYKLSILIAHAFGVIIAPEEIPAFGISNLGNPELRFARENGWKLKLVGRAAAEGDRIRAIVAPQFVPANHRLFAVEEEYNAVVLEGAFLEGQMLLGKGAGSHPTGSAVLSDLSALSYGYKYEYRKLGAEFSEFSQAQPAVNADVKALENSAPADFEGRVYFRYSDPAVLSEIQFIEIEESFRSRDYAYLTGKVRVHELLRLQRAGQWKDLFFAFLPDVKGPAREPVQAQAAALTV